MPTKGFDMSSPWRWIGEALAMCRGHFRVVFGAVSMLMAVALVPSLLQLLTEAVLQPSTTMRMLMQLVFTVIGLVLLPPITGGFYRIAHGLREGRPANAADLFSIFGDGPTALHLIMANLLFLLLTVAVVVALAFGLGGQALLEYLRVVSTLQPDASALPPLPEGMLLMLSLMMLLVMVIATAQNLASAQLAINGGSVLAAVADAFKLTLRNIGSLLLFYLPMLLFGLILLLIFGALVAVAATVLGLIVNPTVAAVLTLPLMLGALLMVYALMLTYFYHFWRDALGKPGNALAATDQHHIAV